jgi:hypothetical protein
MYNRYEVEKRFLKAIKVQDIDLLLPDPKGPNKITPPPNIKLQIEELKSKTKQAELDLHMKLGLLKLMKEAEVAQAKIHKMEAEAKVLEAEAGTVQSKQKINEINTSIALQKERREGMLESIETMTRAFGMMKGNDQFQQQGEPQQGQMPPQGEMPPQTMG